MPPPLDPGNQLGRVTPRPHQEEALRALDGALAAVGRAQLVMACGAGKTLVGRWRAERSQAAVTVVLLPSLALVAQTLQEWRDAQGWPFQALIVCSDPSTADGVRERGASDGAEVHAGFWDTQHARVTTEPDVVSAVLRTRNPRRPLVVFSTYHSATVVASALRQSKITADLVVADEAHNLAGHPREDFRVALTAQMPAAQRLFMTATPVAAVASHEPGFDDWSAPLSMDDKKTFGPVAYRLDFADAIAQKLLTDYRVFVFQVAGEGRTPDPVAALLAAADKGVAKILSFHGRVAKARAFAAAIDGLRLPDGRVVRARSVAGDDPAGQRAAAFAALESATPNEVVVISSCRCLSAGVDLPAVDGILFADPRSSEIDVVQAVGRALRRSPGKKIGTILLPLTVPDDLDDDTALSTGSFRAVWRVLRSLRAMDSRLTADFVKIGPSRRGTPDDSRVMPQIEFHIPALDEAKLQARVADLFGLGWEAFFDELKEFAAAKGHARPGKSTRLGTWCERQRTAHRNAMLAEDRARRLEALPGWVWDWAEQRWLDQWAQVQSLAQRTMLDLDDPDVADLLLNERAARSRITTVGRWCAAQRRAWRRDELSDRQLAMLETIPGFTLDSLDSYDAEAVDLLDEWIAWKGTANVPSAAVEDDVALGVWLNGVRRRNVTGRLSQQLRDEITIVSPADGDGVLQWMPRETMWLLGLEATHAFARREGHLRIPYQHVEELTDIEIPLYDWCTRQRHFARRGKLSPGRRRMLENVPGWEWERQPAPRVLMDIGDARHGTRTGYVKGCRCTPCTIANRTKEIDRQARIAAGLPSSDYVDAGRARAHLRILNGRGATQKQMARATGLNTKTVADLIHGVQSRILPETEQLILALDLETARGAVRPGSLVDAGPTWKKIDDLLRRNWPKSWIAREAGLGSTLQLSREEVTAANALKIDRLYTRVGPRTAPPRQYRRPIPSLEGILAAETEEGRDDRASEVA